MQAEIITIGDELLIGQVINTNASWIARELNATGIAVARVTTVGDDAKAIIDASRRAWKECDVVIVTGGLGPTHDDISKAAVAKLFCKQLLLHPSTLRAVKERFTRMGYTKMPEINISQAMVPEDFHVLKNDRGTAPGLLLYEDHKTFVIIPGVPVEMEFVMAHGILPFLKKKYKTDLEIIQHRTLLTTGIGESVLAEKIGEPKTFLGTNTTLAFLPRPSGVRLRITSHGKNKRAVEKEIVRVESIIRERAEKYIFGVGEETLEAHVLELLANNSNTLSTAESCTGGLIATMLTNVPGASAVFHGSIVAYDNRIKTSELGVKPETLEKFGAVSEETAREMAEGALTRLGTDFAIADTGIAGPDGGTPEKPVGTIWVALAERTTQGGTVKTITKKLEVDFGRNANRERAATTALTMLRARLNS